jgi:hypothetical protein
MTPELTTTLVATLDICAASGLVLHDDVLHVVADDSALLHRYSLQGAPLAAFPLFAGDPPLPEAYAAHKKRKPDLEALALLPDGALLALGSGSTDRRQRGCLLDLQDGTATIIDLRPLYETLGREIPALNIEGAVLRGDTLWLAQRGNSRTALQALIALDAATALRDLAQGILSALGLRRIQPVAPGQLGGIPLAITDLALHPDGRLWFTAAAEDTDNPVDDGVCAGSVIGCFSADFQVAWSAPLPPGLKVEGLHFQRRTADGDHWWLVADADSAETRAPLLSLALPRSQAPGHGGQAMP